MRLDELIGVKKYKDMQLPELITQVMNDNGFVKLGEGSFGVAYRRGNDPFVYKLYLEDDGYSQFVDYAKKHNSIHLPKVYWAKSLSAFWKRAPVDISEQLYIVKIEYITPLLLSNLDEEYIETARIHSMSLLHHNKNVSDIEIYNKLEYMVIDDGVMSKEMLYQCISFSREMQKLIDATTATHGDLDLTSSNYGLRNNTDIVAMDPLFTASMWVPQKHPLIRQDN
jgi:hypothetical protein